MSDDAPFGYWTYGNKDGLFGAASSLVEQPDGTTMLVKDPDYPAVLEDTYILWAVKNDKAALRSFQIRLPDMDAVSQARLNGLVETYPAHFVERQDSTVISDNIQKMQVTAKRQDTTRNPYLEKPRKPGSPSRANTKPDPYPATTETAAESDSISISIPTSLKYATTVTGLPDGLVWNGSVIRGTAPSVSGDTTYVVTVTRTNSLGTAVGTLTLIVSAL